MKNKETLEEFIQTQLSLGKYQDQKSDIRHSIESGAKWQAERMYSEEDMRKAFIAGGNSQIEEDDAYGSAYGKYMEEWFGKFKKK
jgi:hypothetical protein